MQMRHCRRQQLMAPLSNDKVAMQAARTISVSAHVIDLHNCRVQK
jgi:hypothetical protein